MRVNKSLLQKILSELVLAFFVISSLKKVLSYHSISKIFSKPCLPSQSTPIKEIVFYIHGWQRDKNFFEKTYSEDFVPALASNGYLFKDLTWHEHAHSTQVREVQHRIWHNTDGFCDKLLSQVYQTLSENPGVPFRFVGHSLGTQVALRLTNSLTQNSVRYWPHRLALLEPAFVKKFHKDERNSRDICLKLLSEFESKGIAIEVYRSSFITRTSFIGYSNHELISKTPFPSVDLNFHIEDWFDFAKTHSYVKNFYFKSFFSKPVTICGSSMPSAASNTADILNNYGSHFEQTLIGEHAGKFLKTSKKCLPLKCPFMSFLGFSKAQCPKKGQSQALPLK